jgi:hypothetical protein
MNGRITINGEDVTEKFTKVTVVCRTPCLYEEGCEDEVRFEMKEMEGRLDFKVDDFDKLKLKLGWS